MSSAVAVAKRPAMRTGPEHPLCMTDRDAELWWQAQRVVWQIGRKPQNRETSACDDCCREFAEDMRAEGRCDGLYPGEEPEPMPNDAARRRGYATEELRQAARRATYRRAGRRYRALRATP